MSHQKKENNSILSIDIGGTNIKACILSQDGNLISAYSKLPTPKIATPKAVIEIIKQLTLPLGAFEKVSIGFPGYVKYGLVKTAPNLAKDKWTNVDLAQQISNLYNKPVRLINDADQQGLEIVSGKGFEIVLTLGTGLGSALLFDGELLPHLELSHLPIVKNKDYDKYIGDKALKKIGKNDWNKRLKWVIEIYKTVFNYDRLYLGGGNSKEVNLELDDNIKLVSNKDGIKGGARLWAAKEKLYIHTTHPNNKS